MPTLKSKELAPHHPFTPIHFIALFSSMARLTAMSFDLSWGIFSGSQSFASALLRQRLSSLHGFKLAWMSSFLLGPAPIDKANFLAEHFTANSTLDDQNQSLPTCPSHVDINISTVIITPQKDRKDIWRLDISKATEPYHIPAIILKICLIDPILSKLDNLCLSKLVFPPFWKLY